MKNNKGFMKFEMLSVLLFSLGFFCIVFSIVIQKKLDQGFQVMRYDAINYATNAISYQYEEALDVSYLVQTIDSSLFKEIKNPVYGSKYCDKYESNIKIKNNTTHVTLKCGSYLISTKDNDKYSIYRVGKWSSNKLSGDVEVRRVYNYFDSSNNQGFDAYYEKDLFLYMFNKKNGTDYENINDIDSQYRVKSKIVYRKRKLISSNIDG